MAAAFASIANDGVFVQPRLVEATVEGICIHDGRRIHDYNPSLAAMLGLDYTVQQELDPLSFIQLAGNGLFGLLAGAMVATRHVDWYALGGGRD